MPKEYRDFINEYGYNIFAKWYNKPMPKVPLSILRNKIEQYRKETINGQQSE